MRKGAYENHPSCFLLLKSPTRGKRGASTRTLAQRLAIIGSGSCQLQPLDSSMSGAAPDRRRFSPGLWIPPPDNGNDTPARSEPTDETHRRDTQTTADRTRGDSKRTPKQPNRRRQRTAQSSHQGHGRSAPTRARTRAKQATRRAPGSTRPTTRGTPDAGSETTNAQKTAAETAAGRPTLAPVQTSRGAQQARENRGTETQSMRRQAAPTPPSPTSTKNTGKAEKTRKQGQNRW